MDDETIAQIAMNYCRLQSCIKELRDVKIDKNGATLNYVFTHYQYAQKAVEFLNANVPPSMKVRLDLESLERTLIDFGNIPLHL